MNLAPNPPTKLGFYRVLSPLAGVRVSPIQLGAMTIGDKWGPYGLGSTTKESSFQLLDAYFNMGGNFIDTANNYQNQTSEEFIGEWMEARRNRDQIVLATKYSIMYKVGDDSSSIAQKVNYVGNSSKSLKLSIRDSLRKLRTDYVDILYVHYWDYETPVSEIMNSLHNLIVEGKVLYLGISDTPAWVVSQANMYANLHGKTPFSIYQGEWNVMDRSFERDIIPMAKSLGIALAPWNVLGGGKFRTDAEEEERRRSDEHGRTITGSWERNEDEVKISRALEKVATELGTKNVRAVAIAYVMQKAPYVFPVLGARKVEQLKSNIEALDISLSPEQMKYLEGILPFDRGFPTGFFGDGTEYNFFLKSAAKYSKQPGVQPIAPVQLS
ncbi:NADP-dependent oxidoreductase domain-containing protein [Collybia nuda]|uniref:NADP-dependent oxidoreductase domain-containing protein n=1 Tax=Collybia nuda TaxID=64659 RepID=A0A9P5Y213_9AGAR|nr:NADP-dependent oxidoreductase domain-containing protein [Collybia nuda]